MKYVYILNVYDEYGPEQIEATLDRNQLADIIKNKSDLLYVTDDVLANLSALLGRSDEEIIGGHELGKGWGGIQLHVVELSEAMVDA